MATKRFRNGTYEYIVKRAKLLPKPWHYYTKNEEEGDAIVAKVEAYLDRGIVPPELVKHGEKYAILAELIRDYLRHHAVPNTDIRLLNVIYERKGATPINSLNYGWVEDWVVQMKAELNLAPGTIRHYVGALARCFDWGSNKKVVALAINPVRLLPKNYAQYSESDVKLAQTVDKEFFKRLDDSRHRRIEPSEEEAIRKIMAGVAPEAKQRSFSMPFRAALELVFDLGIETAMRLREIYTLTMDQIDFEQALIFLEKTKNGSSRQVPLSTVAVAKLRAYYGYVDRGERGMEAFKFEQLKGYKKTELRIFPWWNGSIEQDNLGKVTSLLSAQFARIFEAAGSGDIRFHDTRHEATCRFFERTDMQDFEIMKITGHSSTRMLARYANLKGGNLAKKLW